MYKKHPAELKFVLVDPKQVEFSLYGILEHHYLAKLPDEEEAIITDPLKVVTTLNSLCVEMENRYNLLKNANVKWEFLPSYEDDIAKEHEKYIVEHFNGPVFIKDWPKDIKAYYMKLNPDGKTVAAVDLVVPGSGELMGGSQREENYDVLVSRMKELNIDADHVVRHGDTQPKNCPSSIMKNGGENWVYFKEQLKTRNEQNKPINLNTSTLTVQPGNNMGSSNTGGGGGATQLSTGGYGVTLLDTPLYASPTDIEVQLPDVDHRENNTNMDEVKGLSLIFYPPYNSCDATEAREHFALFNYIEFQGHINRRFRGQ